MNVGFTGTREVITETQLQVFRYHLCTLDHKQFSEFHHGGCIGADYFAHKLMLELQQSIYPRTTIIVHPSSLPMHRVNYWAEDWSLYADSDKVKVLPPQRPLTRNKHIIKRCDYFFALPNTQYERAKSGTWATIRYAEYLTKPGIVIYPDGEIYRV